MTWHQIIGHKGPVQMPGASGLKGFEPLTNFIYILALKRGRVLLVISLNLWLHA